VVLKWEGESFNREEKKEFGFLSVGAIYFDTTKEGPGQTRLRAEAEGGEREREGGGSPACPVVCQRRQKPKLQQGAVNNPVQGYDPTFRKGQYFGGVDGKGGEKGSVASRN